MICNKLILGKLGKFLYRCTCHFITVVLIRLMNLHTGCYSKHPRGIVLAPVRIVGDFNAQLPRLEDKLNRLWYKKRGYNRHSSILYDFILKNDLHAADFMFNQ